MRSARSLIQERCSKACCPTSPCRQVRCYCYPRICKRAWSIWNEESRDMRLKVRKHVSRLSPSEGVFTSAMCTAYSFQQCLSPGLSSIECRVNGKCRLHTSSTASQPGLHCTRTSSRVCVLATLCYFHRSNGITGLIGRGYGESVPTLSSLQSWQAAQSSAHRHAA